MSSNFKNLVDGLLGRTIQAFGEEVIYKPSKGGEYRLCGVFDRNFEQVDPDSHVVIASNIPMLGVNLNDMFEKPTQGDLVEIEDEIFKVVDSQEDGQGGASLILQKVG